MKSILAAVIVLSGLFLNSRQSSGASHAIARAQTRGVQEIVVAVHARSIVVRSARSLSTRAVPSSTHIYSADNHVLRLDSIRPGDRILVNASGSIRDLSQRMLSVSGLVDLSADGRTVPQVLLVRGSISLLADVSSATRYLDPVRATGDITDVADGDALALQGIYDAHLGEMTQTASVTRTGPVLKRHTTHAGNG